MKGIQIIRLMDIVTVSSVTNVPNVYPRTLRVRGKDFYSIEVVSINGFETTDFTIESPYVLTVVVPEPIQEARITTVSVLSNRLTMSESSIVTLSLGTKPTTAKGTLRLLQNFVRLLFRSPGTNIFYPSSGGGLQQIVQADNIDVAKVSGEISIGIRRTREFIVNAQSGVKSIPTNERLLSAELINIGQRDPTSIEASVQITTHAGTVAAASFVT